MHRSRPAARHLQVARRRRPGRGRRGRPERPALFLARARGPGAGGTSRAPHSSPERSRDQIRPRHGSRHLRVSFRRLRRRRRNRRCGVARFDETRACTPETRKNSKARLGPPRRSDPQSAETMHRAPRDVEIGEARPDTLGRATNSENDGSAAVRPEASRAAAEGSTALRLRTQHASGPPRPGPALFVLTTRAAPA